MIGRKIGNYLVESELGSGGMGTVWAATTRRAVAGLPRGTRVALKTVHPHLARSENVLTRFEREAKVGQRVRHPNVVRTLDFGTARTGLMGMGEQVPYIALEFVQGQTLREYADSHGVISDALARHIGAEIATGLAAIHEAGALHRDIKPRNVLITPDHYVKVMDLGIALQSDDDVRMTQTGAIVGSIPWMAPERLYERADVDGRSDLYALGVVLYELLANVHPFMGDTAAAVMTRVLGEEPNRVGTVNSQVSAFLEEVIHALMSKDPAGRFADGMALAEALECGEDGAWWRERAPEIRRSTERPLRRPRIPRETAVYGRDAELAQLCGQFEDVKAGHGRVVLIEGEAGIGKSRLVDEFVSRLAAEGEELDFVFGTYPPGGAATATDGFAQALREHVGDDGTAHLLPELPALVPAFDALLRSGIAPDGAVALTRESLQTCFVHALRTLAGVRPTVVLIDDLHFAPGEGRALFSALAMAVPGHRLMLIGNTRPRGANEWTSAVTHLPQTTLVTLTRLGPKDLMHVLEDCFESAEIARRLGGHVAAKSDGNPFFALEIVNGLRDGAFVTRDADGAWRTSGEIESMAVPSSVVDLVQARVGELGDDERALLDIAACCGYEFDGVLIAAALGVARIPVFQMLARLEGKHRLVRAAGRRFQFDHNQVQEVLHEALPEVLREEYHAALGEALESTSGATAKGPDELDGALAADLCGHFVAAGRGERALRYFDAAWQHLMHQVRHATAVDLARRLLALDGAMPADVEVQILKKLDLTLWRSGHLDEASKVTDRLVALQRVSGGTLELVEALAASADRCQDKARGVEAQARLDEAWSLVGDADPPARLAHSTCLVLMDKGRNDEAIEHMRRELALAKAEGRPERVRPAEAVLGGLLRATGAPAHEVHAHYLRAIEIAREMGEVAGEFGPTNNLGTSCRSLGRVTEAIRHFERAANIAQRIGLRRGEAITAGNLGGLLAELGDVELAWEYDERCLQLARETGSRRVETYALHQLGGACWNQGELSEAERHTRLAVELRRAMGYVQLPASLEQLGAIVAEAGRHDEARELQTETLKLAREHDHAQIVVTAAAHLAMLPGGSVDAALSEFERHAADVDENQQLSIHIMRWRLTGEREHLESAYALLETWREKLPDRYREAFVQNLRDHRQLAEAWAAANLA